MTDSGRLASPPGYPDKPEPVPVSALRAGIPSAVQRVTPEMLEAWVNWDCGLEPDKPLTPRQCTMLRLAFYDGWFAAQAIEARRAETQGGSVACDESAVREADAPQGPLRPKDSP